MRRVSRRPRTFGGQIFGQIPPKGCMAAKTGATVALRHAENILGRRINPVIHTRESFRIKYAAGDPFLLDVYRREKIPVLLPSGRTSTEDFEDELRTMATERMAASQ